MPTKKYTLRFRAVDQHDFNEIKDGLKTVETRAATARYHDIEKGDVLTFLCGKQKIQKRVARVRHFKTIGSMLKAIPLKKIFPSVRTIADARNIYYGYPSYKEKINRFGLVALELK